MNRVGINYSYWTHDWDADFVPFLDRAKRLGFDVLEIQASTLGKMSGSQIDRLRAASQETGVPLSCCIGLPPSADLASSDALVRRAGIAQLGRIANAMVRCSIDRLSGILYSSWPASMEGRTCTREQALEWSIAGMKTAIKGAEDLGLTYCVEVVNRYEQFMLNTAAEAVEYVRAVGSPNLKILLDTYHMNIEEDSFEDAILAAGGLLGHVHIGESNRKPPGQGRLPWKEIGASLKKVGYAGWVVMEPFLKPGGEIGRDIRVNRDLMPGADLDEEARRACAFTRGFLA